MSPAPPPDPAAAPAPGALVIAEDGFAEVTIGGTTRRLDVYRAYNLLLAADDRARASHPGAEDTADRQVAYLDGVTALLADLGYGAVSHRAADKFDAALAEAVDALKKADGSGPTPASPAPTAPAP